MSRSELKQRLRVAQEAITQALKEGDIESLPELVSSRETDFRELVNRMTNDVELRNWAMEYLARDRDIVSAAEAQREQVGARLLEVQHNKSVHRLYMSEGTRR